MIGKTVCSGRSLLSRSTVSTTTFPWRRRRAVEHRIERVARDRLGQDVDCTLQGELPRLGHHHIVEPDVGHQRRVLVLLGHDRVVQRLAELPQCLDRPGR